MLVRVNGICVNDSGLYAPVGTLHHQENFILSEHGVKHFPAQQTANRRSIRCTVTVASDLSARIDLTASPEGIFLERLRKIFASFTPQTSRQFFEKYASSIAPQAEILASRFENDQLFLSLRIPDFAIRSGKFIILPLPGHQQLTAAAAIPPEKRQTPFLSSSQEDLLLEYIISVPENFTVVKPETANVSIENIFFHSGYLNVGGKHILEFSWQETPSLFTPEKFEYLREINRMINRFSTKNILFIME